jgi:hypothetical protein
MKKISIEVRTRDERVIYKSDKILADATVKELKRELARSSDYLSKLSK